MGVTMRASGQVADETETPVSRTVSVEEACAILGIGTSTGYDLIKDGRWPPEIRVVHLGTRIRVVRADLDTFFGPIPAPLDHGGSSDDDGAD